MQSIGKTYTDSKKTIVIDLDSHQRNVSLLVKNWDVKFNPYTKFKDLIEAAESHDIGKKSGWYIKEGRIYPPPRHAVLSSNFLKTRNLYVKELIKLHHSFSTPKIVESMAKLKADGYNDYESFPNDLYILITCDWIESGILSYLFASKDTYSHPFEEFLLNCLMENTFTLLPYPLNKDELSFKTKFAEISKIRFKSAKEFFEQLKDLEWNEKVYTIKKV